VRHPGGRRLQRQPRVGRLDHRGHPARITVHRGQPDLRPPSDRPCPHPVHPAGVGLRWLGTTGGPGPDTVAAGGGSPMTTTAVLADGSGLPGLSNVPTWLGDSANWMGINGITTLVRQQLTYTVVAVVIDVAVALSS